MGTDQVKFIHKIQDIQSKLLNNSIDYWQEYSSFGTWQFWVVLSFFILPLIAIYVFIDKKRALLLGFFGFNVHVWFTYIDLLGGINNFWFYPYKIFPFFATSFALDVSLIPMLYMFVYQWTLNHMKNYYLYILILCGVLAFVFKPILSMLDLFELNKGTNYFHIFLAYILVALLSKIITNIFIYFQQTSYRKIWKWYYAIGSRDCKLSTFPLFLWSTLLFFMNNIKDRCTYYLGTFCFGRYFLYFDSFVLCSTINLFRIKMKKMKILFMGVTHTLLISL